MAMGGLVCTDPLLDLCGVDWWASGSFDTDVD